MTSELRPVEQRGKPIYAQRRGSASHSFPPDEREQPEPLNPEGLPCLRDTPVDYSLQFRKHSPLQHYEFYADEVVEVEEFFQELLSRAMGLHAIRHDGSDVPKAKFDRMVRIAVGEITAESICTTLHIKANKERQRFGFVA